MATADVLCGGTWTERQSGEKKVGKVKDARSRVNQRVKKGLNGEQRRQRV
jgi:hypothetical protein